MKSIDLNCDMGEIPAAIEDGSQEALMPFLTSVNIACGGHAGDDSTMRASVAQALRWKLALGAHPGYPDRANFGRIAMSMPLAEVEDLVFEQVTAFARIAAEAGTGVAHVKPHGALYNSAVVDRGLARAIAQGVKRWRQDVVLFGLAGSSMLDVFRGEGFPVAAEAFADRRYEPDGSLRSRKYPDSLLTNATDAGRQVENIARRGMVIAGDGSEVSIKADTICIHGDNPGAREIAEEAARVLGRTRA